MQDISALNSLFSEQVLTQAAQVEQLFQEAVEASERRGEGQRVAEQSHQIEQLHADVHNSSVLHRYTRPPVPGPLQQPLWPRVSYGGLYSLGLNVSQLLVLLPSGILAPLESPSCCCPRPPSILLCFRPVDGRTGALRSSCPSTWQHAPQQPADPEAGAISAAPWLSVSAEVLQLGRTHAPHICRACVSGFLLSFTSSSLIRGTTGSLKRNLRANSFSGFARAMSSQSLRQRGSAGCLPDQSRDQGEGRCCGSRDASSRQGVEEPAAELGSG